MSVDLASGASVFALLTDGSTVEVRHAAPTDLAAVTAMHEAMSDRNAYLRFLGASRAAAEAEARRLCREPDGDHAALLALRGGRVVGAAGYEPTGTPQTAEVAFAVADDMHGRGVATLLLEHLVLIATRRGVRTLIAETLAENTEMLRVFADAGLPVQRRLDDGVVEVTVTLPGSQSGRAGRTLDDYLAVVAAREGQAEVASLRRVLRPESVVVVGASRRQGSVGRAILRNIVTGGYAGRVYAVNPHATRLEHVACLPSVTALPEPVDLAVLAVPPAAVLAVAADCGRRGVAGLVVITSGLDESTSADLVATCRRSGMRLIGPNCFGVAVPGIGLDATFAAQHPTIGTVGIAAQSGGLGFALGDQLSRVGVGISSLVSVGNKLDVSANDLLAWWEQDGVTRVAVLYLESFGNPRKFARTARRVGATMPVVAVQAGRSPAGAQAAASHTAAATTGVVSKQALFRQAGVIATKGVGEALNVAALLATQPVPAGRTIAIVTNAGGAGVLAADACGDHGLHVHTPRPDARRRLRAILPPGSAVTGPVDTTAVVDADRFRQALEVVAADGDVDAVLAITVPTAATGDLVSAVRAAAVTVPLIAVALEQREMVRLWHRTSGDRTDAPAGRDGADTVAGASGGRFLPVYVDPEAAVAAVAQACDYGAWRSRPVGTIPDLDGVRFDDAQAVVQRHLDRVPAGGWLAPDHATDLLTCYGIPFVPMQAAADEETAVRLAAACHGPVVLKADVPDLVHKSDAGAVLLDLRTEAEVREAYRSLRERFRDRLRRVLVQPMITGGTEVIVGVSSDAVFGPLVVFGLGGTTTDVLDDHAARLSPLTDVDADELIGSTRAALLLRGHRGTPPADLAALRDLLLRVSRMADDLPQVTEADLNPVIARPDGVHVVDARVRVSPARPRDHFLRDLR